MEDSLSGVVAIVTGAASGIGHACARAFVDRGAMAIMTDIDADQGHAAANQLGDRAVFIEHDVTKAHDWDRVLELTTARFGPVGVLINNAGIFRSCSIVKTSLEEFRQVMDVNAIGTFLGMKSVIASMKSSAGGSIINISSTAGLAGSPNMVSYVASKFAVRGMTKVAALELGGDGIRVNSIHPGVISTNMTVGASPPAGMPIARMGQPGEVASLAAYLASPEAAFITGAEFVIDGGYSNISG